MLLIFLDCHNSSLLTFNTLEEHNAVSVDIAYSRRDMSGLTIPINGFVLLVHCLSDRRLGIFLSTVLDVIRFSLVSVLIMLPNCLTYIPFSLCLKEAVFSFYRFKMELFLYVLFNMC